MTELLIQQTLLNAEKSVDTFFVLSGIFVTLGLLNQLQKNGRINYLSYYLQRILRFEIIFTPLNLVHKIKHLYKMFTIKTKEYTFSLLYMF